MTYPGDPSALLLGSEDATTCHILILREPMSGVTGLAHVDVLHADSLDKIRDEILQLAKERIAKESGEEIREQMVYL